MDTTTKVLLGLLVAGIIGYLVYSAMSKKAGAIPVSVTVISRGPVVPASGKFMEISLNLPANVTYSVQGVSQINPNLVPVPS